MSEQHAKPSNGKRSKGRQLSADEKRKILAEARQPGATVAETLRRYQREGTTFYRWEREAKAAMREALGGKPRGGDARARELEREIARLRAELEKKRQVISEVVEENLTLKGGSERADCTRFSAEAKQELLTLVTCTQARTGWTVRRILQRLGLSKARYRDWSKRASRDALTARATAAPTCDAILPEET